MQTLIRQDENNKFYDRYLYAYALKKNHRLCIIKLNLFSWKGVNKKSMLGELSVLLLIFRRRFVRKVQASVCSLAIDLFRLTVVEIIEMFVFIAFTKEINQSITHKQMENACVQKSTIFYRLDGACKFSRLRLDDPKLILKRAFFRQPTMKFQFEICLQVHLKYHFYLSRENKQSKLSSVQHQ